SVSPHRAAPRFATPRTLPPRGARGGRWPPSTSGRAEAQLWQDRRMPTAGGARLRREPPPFRSVTVRGADRLGPRMVRVTFGGADLAGLIGEHPAASVRVLLPSPGTADLVIPSWNGNEFLLPDGRRPVIRTFTPLRVTAGPDELDLEIVIHGGGAASAWADAVAPGGVAAVSGPGRG